MMPMTNLVFTQTANTATDTDNPCVWVKIYCPSSTPVHRRLARPCYHQYLIKEHGDSGGQRGQCQHQRAARARSAQGRGESDDHAMGHYRPKV